MILGITGPAGCGKDTVGTLLREYHEFNIDSFAKPLQTMVCNLLGYDHDKWADREWREKKIALWGCTPRYMAQTLGTEWGRDCIKKTLWMDLTFHEYILYATNLAITDVRFPNEANRIREMGGHIIHVHRTQEDAGFCSARAQHASEQGVQVHASDFVINNFGTISALATQVALVVDKIQELNNEEIPDNLVSTR